MENLKLFFKLCPNCSFFCGIEEPDKFCSACGEELISECPSCGEKITNPYAKFCKYCGNAYPGKTTSNNKYYGVRK